MSCGLESWLWQSTIIAPPSSTESAFAKFLVDLFLWAPDDALKTVSELVCFFNLFRVCLKETISPFSTDSNPKATSAHEILGPSILCRLDFPLLRLFEKKRTASLASSTMLLSRRLPVPELADSGDEEREKDRGRAGGGGTARVKVVETAPNAKSSMSKVRTARGDETFGPVSLLPFSSSIDVLSASWLLYTNGRGWQSSFRAVWLWKNTSASFPWLKTSCVAPQVLQTKLWRTGQATLLEAIKFLLWQFLQDIFKQEDDNDNLENDILLNFRSTVYVF